MLGFQLSKFIALNPGCFWIISSQLSSYSTRYKSHFAGKQIDPTTCRFSQPGLKPPALISALVDTLCANAIDSQVSFFRTRYGFAQSGVGLGSEGAVEDEFSAYGAGDVNAYPVAVQLFVVELNSLANSSS